MDKVRCSNRSLLLVGIKLVETVGTRAGLRFEGLTNEIQQEINVKGQLYVLLQEINIEAGLDAYTSPKKELCFKLGMKLLEIDSKNRAIERHLTLNHTQTMNVTDPLKNQLNTELQNKYDDL